jgi:hypothetical protein
LKLNAKQKEHKTMIRKGFRFSFGLLLFIGLLLALSWDSAANRQREFETQYQQFVLDQFDHIEFCLEGYHKDKGRYPIELSELTRYFEDGSDDLQVFSRDCRGNSIQYRNPPVNNSEKPDLWVIDAVSGKQISNWKVAW